MFTKRITVLLLTLILLCAAALPTLSEEEKAASAQYVLAGFDDTSMRQWATNRFFTQMEEKSKFFHIFAPNSIHSPSTPY